MNCLGIGVKMDDVCDGQPAGANQGFWKGKFDDMGFWSRALSPVEIQAIYNSGLLGRSIGDASLAPMLEEHLSGTNVVFSWPETPLGRGFVLESTTSLTPASWAPAGGTPIVANGRVSVTRPASPSQGRYYRLHQQL
jgi:hypothetical protein